MLTIMHCKRRPIFFPLVTNVLFRTDGYMMLYIVSPFIRGIRPIYLLHYQMTAHLAAFISKYLKFPYVLKMTWKQTTVFQVQPPAEQKRETERARSNCSQVNLNTLVDSWSLMKQVNDLPPYQLTINGRYITHIHNW